MARDAMRILRTVRRRSVEETRRALGACLMAEKHAEDIIQAIDDKAQGDRAAHRLLEGAHWFSDMFARRLGTSGAERRTGEAALTDARASTAEARLAVVAARTAAEMVETLIAERLAAAKADADRREQHALDDMTRPRFDPAHRPAVSKAR